jgi:hypothetical protein
MDDLVVGALEEGRIDGAERPISLRGQPRREGDGVLLRNSHVEGPLRMRSGEFIHAGAGRHCSGDRTDLGVGIREFRQRLAENVLVGRRTAAALRLLAGDDVELHHTVIFIGRVLRRSVALALLGDDVDEHRPFLGVADIFQHFDQRVDVMTVDGPDIIEAELVEESAAGEHAAGILLHPVRGDVERLGHCPRELLGDPPRGKILPRADQARQRISQRADRRRDRHVVVVEDDDEAVTGCSGIVHRLIGHARAHRPVADDRDRVMRVAGKLVGDREAERRRDRGRAVRCSERVVVALASLGEARQASALAQRADPVAASGQDLVGIGLVADVPNELVARRIEHIVERDRELDDTEARAKMAAGHRHCGNRLVPKLFGKLGELRLVEPPEFLRQADRIQQRRVRAFRHGARHYPQPAALSPKRRCKRDDFSKSSDLAQLFGAGAVLAGAADLDDRPPGGKAGIGGGFADSAGQCVIVDVDCLSAIVADQEDAIVKAVRMPVGDVGVLALDPPCEVGADEQVEDPVHAIGCDPPVLRFRHRFGDIIGAGRPLEPRQCVEHGLAHVRPLLALGLEPLAGCATKRFPFVELVFVRCHLVVQRYAPTGAAARSR